MPPSTAGEAPQVFGSDYPTPDGSCIRDYIHVSDLADAHVAAAPYCEEQAGRRTFSMSARGEGASVWEVMAAVSEAVGRDIGAVAVARRPGDPPELVASADRIDGVLGWQARRDLAEMVSSARLD